MAYLPFTFSGSLGIETNTREQLQTHFEFAVCF